MKYYLLVVSNIFMLNVAELALFFKCQKIADIIIKQCKINSEFIEKEIL